MDRIVISRRHAVAAGVMGVALLSGCDAAPEAPGIADTPEITDRPGSSPVVENPDPEPTPAEKALARMTLEQKVAQLFFVTPEGLTGASVATVAGTLTADALAQIPVGGLVYFSQNLESAQQVRDLLSGTAALCRDAGAGIAPFLGVDEEGGPLVARIANSGLFDVPRFPNMADIGATGDPAQAAAVGTAIGTYLHDIGFNVDFAPDADVLTNPSNTAIGARSFGADPSLVASMVAAEVEAMRETGTLPCVKHFPGHGDTAGDSHTGAVYAERLRVDMDGKEIQKVTDPIHGTVARIHKKGGGRDILILFRIVFVHAVIVVIYPQPERQTIGRQKHILCVNHEVSLIIRDKRTGDVGDMHDRAQAACDIPALAFPHMRVPT